MRRPFFILLIEDANPFNENKSPVAESEMHRTFNPVYVGATPTGRTNFHTNTFGNKDEVPDGGRGVRVAFDTVTVAERVRVPSVAPDPRCCE